MSKDRVKRARKYSNNGSTNYRPDTSLWQMILNVCFITSKFGVDKCKGFQLNKLHFVKPKSVPVGYKSDVTEYKFQIAEYKHFLFNVRVIF